MGTSKLPIGIDLGTTNCCIAILIDDKPETIQASDSSTTYPSFVQYDQDSDNIITGHYAKLNADSLPKNTINGFKRLMGIYYQDDIIQQCLSKKYFTYDIVNKDGYPRIKVQYDSKEQFLFPQQVSAHLLESLMKSASRCEDADSKIGVIGVPAHFNMLQRKAVKDCAEIAGFEILALINEPTAAAIYCGAYDDMKNGQCKTIVVIDLGGGTFDITVMELEIQENNKRILKVKSSIGDLFLGGDDFTQSMVEHVYSQSNLDPNDDELRVTIRTKCEVTKHVLSKNKDNNIMSKVRIGKIEVGFSLKSFKELTSELTKKCSNLMKKALVESKLKLDQIGEVIVIGGASQMPCFKTEVKNVFVEKNIFWNKNPDYAVALGLGMYASMLNKKATSPIEEVLLKEQTTMNLGVGLKEKVTDEEEMTVAIQKGAIPPTENSVECTTIEDNDTHISLPVYAGNFPLTKDNVFLGELEVKDIPEGQKADIPLIKVTFDFKTVDELIVTALDITNYANGILN